MKPSRGIFDLVADAPLDDVAKFLRREYRAEGWKVINDQEIEVNGAKGLDFLFGKDTNQKSAGFSAQENEAGVLITVRYSDNSRL